MKFSDILTNAELPVYMGIVNATPDSFSDGGKYFSEDYSPVKAVDAALTLEDQGAGIIDLGGESTRPNAAPVSLEEELRRLEPVLERLDGRLAVPLSVDTYKPQVAQSALERGAAIINDIFGGTDPAMREVWRRFQPGVVIMHNKVLISTNSENAPVNPFPNSEAAGKNQDSSTAYCLMSTASYYKDVVQEVWEELERRRDAAIQDGLPKENISLDVGIGFGKTAQDNWTLIDNISEFHSLGCPLVVGVSRKRFLNFSDEKTAEVGKRLADNGVQILRVHKLPE
ncbi:MAG: dihydropteroate synthase family protein [Thermoguttaceae bacterium]|nr:dihydropteroate synthase family protein [Thermoguttaceae bacterium]